MIKQNITDSLESNYMPYSAHVIMNRALPEIDGFKPSQRRILYTMYKMNLLSGQRKKSQSVVGQTMFIHPHGDLSIYETMVRMTVDNDAFLVPYIDSEGNFGKVYSRDMQEASARYTDVRLEKVSKELFKDIDKNTVDMIDSYDGEMKEPRLLPVTFPSILTNSSSGMAVGMASNIPSFNLNEVIDFTINFIKNQNIDVSDYIKAPDFPTGGEIIYNENDFNNIYNTGRGSFKIRATHKVEGNSIIFEEIPYTTTFEVIIDRITNLIKSGKFKDIVDINDIYGINTKGIEIIVKNNTDKDTLIEMLYRSTPLESSFGCNFNIVASGKPVTTGIKGIILEWVRFRAETIKRGAQFDLNYKIERIHMLKALEKVMLDIDKAISIIRKSKSEKEAIQGLIENLSLDSDQAKYVADVKLIHLNKDYLSKRVNEINELNKDIDELNKIINNKKALANLMIKQLRDVKKNYGEDRKSKIISESKIPEINTVEASIENYNLKLFITEQNYIKKIPLTSLRGNFNIRVKDDDKLSTEIELDNLSEVLVFTNKRNVYKIKCHELDNHRPSELGEYLPSFLKLKDEEIIYVTATKDFKEDLLIGFDDGRVAVIELSAYETKQNRSVLRNAYADKNAIYFSKVDESVDLFAIATDNKAMMMNTKSIKPKSTRGTVGVIFMRLRNDEKVDKYEIVDGKDYEYYRLSNAGVGKYLKEGDFR